MIRLITDLMVPLKDPNHIVVVVYLFFPYYPLANVQIIVGLWIVNMVLTDIIYVKRTRMTDKEVNLHLARLWNLICHMCHWWNQQQMWIDEQRFGSCRVLYSCVSLSHQSCITVVFDAAMCWYMSKLMVTFSNILHLSNDQVSCDVIF